MIPAILNNKSIWKFYILASYSPGAGYTRNEIKKLIRWNNLTLDRTLKKLIFYKLIKKNKRIIKLNFENKMTEKILEIIEFEKNRFNMPSFELFYILTETLEKIEDMSIEEIYLFGSHSKKTASIHSDIDLAIISKDKIDCFKAKEYILEKFEKNIQFHYITNKEFKEKTALIKNIQKDGVKIL